MSLCVHVLVCMCVYVDGSVFHLPPDIHLIYRLQLQYADFFFKIVIYKYWTYRVGLGTKNAPNAHPSMS